MSIYVCIYIYIPTYIHTYIHHTHTSPHEAPRHIHTHIHNNIHTHIPNNSSPPHAIRLEARRRAALHTPSDEIPTLLDTATLIPPNFGIANSATSGAISASSNSTPQAIYSPQDAMEINQSFLPLYFPLNQKYVAQVLFLLRAFLFCCVHVSVIRV